MATPEILSLLCAGSVRYHAGLGGRANALLTRAEIAGLLAGLPVEARDLALAKYAGCVDSERLLIARVRTWAAGVAVKEQWDIERGKPVLCNLSALAVFEVVRPNRCGTCKGTGYKGVRICPTCNGAGMGKLAGVAIAAACELSAMEFSRHWRGRYELVYRHVADMDGQIGRVLRAVAESA